MIKSRKIVGVMIFRDDEWSTGYTIPAALHWCDELVVVIDSRSSVQDPVSLIKVEVDKSRVHSVTVTPKDRFDFREADMREAGLHVARELGATHIGVIDADEALSGVALRNFDMVRHRVLSLRPGEVMCAPQLAPWRGLLQARVDGDFANYAWSFAFCDSPGVTHINTDNYQIHRRLPLGDWKHQQLHDASVVHFQFASELRLRCKALWYKLVERERYTNRITVEQLNAMYDWTLRDQPGGLFVNIDLSVLTFESAVECYDARMLVDLNCPPWHLAAAKELALHKPSLLVGVNTLGLDHDHPEFASP